MNERRNDVTDSNPLPWYAHHDNIVMVAEWMVHGDASDAEALLDFLRKPWHYDDEYAEAKAWFAEQTS